MKVIGIIAEYNPFHNGHAYQIKKIKEDMQADFVVVAMSGDFVQRGAPAIIDKYTRTKMALNCGADLVIELPVLWATASAEYFAMAGVTLFDKMGCVDGICFGAETNDLDALSLIADVLVCEPENYRTALVSYLKNGMTFPVARSKALCDYFAVQSDTNSCNHSRNNTYFDIDIISTILSEPNNILGIEYLKALKQRNSSIKPYIIKRKGAGYHDATINTISQSTATVFSSDNHSSVPTASATAIRLELDTLNSSDDFRVSDALTGAMPKAAVDILKEYITQNTFLYANDFSSILGYQLLTSDITVLSDIGDSNPDIANRLNKNRMNLVSYEKFCELNKSKDVTYSRISRILLHLILNIQNIDYALGKQLDYIPYFRILGFKKDSTILLKELKSHSAIPIIPKLADAHSLLNDDALKLLEKDIFAADLYSQVCANKHGQNAHSEYTKQIIRV